MILVCVQEKRKEGGSKSSVSKWCLLIDHACLALLCFCCFFFLPKMCMLTLHRYIQTNSVNVVHPPCPFSHPPSPYAHIHPTPPIHKSTSTPHPPNTYPPPPPPPAARVLFPQPPISPPPPPPRHHHCPSQPPPRVLFPPPGWGCRRGTPVGFLVFLGWGGGGGLIGRGEVNACRCMDG